MISSCQHAFCLGCIILKFEGKSQHFECPNCLQPFSPPQVIPCKAIQTLIDNLHLVCKNCGCEFQKRGTFEEHKKVCSREEAHSLTVDDLLNLDLTSPIPKPVERATLRILKHKVKNSENGMTAEFDSGGPRVRTIFLTSICYKGLW